MKKRMALLGKWLGKIYRRYLIPLLVVILALACWSLFARGIGTWLQQSVPWLWTFIDTITRPDGIKAVMTATGAVCFALTYVNTAREKRVKGILMEYVIRDRYPHYGWVFVLHFLFAVVGQYACAVEARTAGVVCLLGMLLSLAYALKMALSVTFSTKRGEQIVSQYIEKSSINTPENRENQLWLIYQVGQYVFELFLENNLPDNKYLSEESKSTDVPCQKNQVWDSDVIQQLLKLSGMNCHLLYLQSDSLLNQFDQVFGMEEDSSVETDYILYSLPKYKPAQKILKDNILVFCQMWQSVLSKAGDVQQQTELVYRVLSARRGQNITPALCCGLVLYLHRAKIFGIDAEINTDSWTRCVRLLAQINHIGKVNNRGHDEFEMVQIQCRDMLAVFLCLTLLEQAKFNKNLLSDAFREAIVEELCQYRGANSVYWSEKVLRKYLCYAYVIYQTLEVTALQLPSRQEMYRIIPIVIQTVRTWLI